MQPEALLEALPALLALAAAGRAVLALLPPGWPGYHDRRELAPTWGACHLLGLLGLALAQAAFDACGVAPGAPLLLAPFALLALARLALLPGAVRPRHEPRAETGERLARPLLLLALAGLARPLLDASDPESALLPALDGPLAAALSTLTSPDALRVVAAAGLAAAAALTWGALERARRYPVGRAGALLLLVALPLPASIGVPGLGATTIALALAAIAAGAVAWRRRADRRGRALLLAGAVLLATSHPLGVAPAVLALGLLLLPGVGLRPLLSAGTLVPLALGAAVGVLSPLLDPAEILAASRVAYERLRAAAVEGGAEPDRFGAFVVPALLAAVLVVHARQRASEAGAGTVRVDAPRDELLQLALFALGVALVAVAFGPGYGLALAFGLAGLLPLLFGLALLPPERTGERG